MQNPPMIFTCDICKIEIPQQFKFFEHLKLHYEEEVAGHATLVLQDGVEHLNQDDTERIEHQSYLQKNIEDRIGDVKEEEEQEEEEEAEGGGGGSGVGSNLTEPEEDKKEEGGCGTSSKVKAVRKRGKKAEKFLQQQQQLINPIEEELGGGNDDQFQHDMEGEEPEGEGDDQFEGEDLMESDNDDGDDSKSKKKRKPGGKRQEVLKCSECDRIFNHRNSLVYHMRSHTGERPHQCDMCGKSFFATSALKVHMRLHSGEKPYKCEHCGRNFRQWGDLKYHVISIHSDIRQYQCEFCGKDFARKYSLIVHRRIHTGERNYKCEFCSKCFRAASYLQNHRRIHTGEKPHSCTTCGKPFRVRSDMKRHMASHNRDHNNPTIKIEPHTNTSSSNSNSQQIQQQSIHNVVTVSSADQIITIGPQITQLVRGTLQVPVTSEDLGHGGQGQQILDGEEVISGDIPEGTPINITLSQDGTASLDAATVISSADLPEGVIYPNRDGNVETVTIRDTNTGTLYVWPVLFN